MMNKISEFLEDFRLNSNDISIGMLGDHEVTQNKRSLFIPNHIPFELDEFARWVRENHTKYHLIFVTASAESLCTESVKTFRELDKIKGVSEKLCYVTSAMPCPYNTQMIHHYLGRAGVDIYYINNWPTADLDSNSQDQNRSANLVPVHKDKLYTCFNVWAKPHRYAVVSELVRSGLYRKGYTSLLEQPEHIVTENNQDLKNIFPDYFRKWSNLWKQKNHLMPMELNYTGVTRFDIVPEDLEMYNNSYLSIITETMYLNKHNSDASFDRGLCYEPSRHTQFLTEKTYRTIRACHPFILVTTPGNLQCLRDTGYQTFHPWIDESYDQIEDDQARLTAIINELKRLNRQSPREWLEWQQGVRPILEHNLDLLMQTQTFCIHHTQVDNYLAQFNQEETE